MTTHHDEPIVVMAEEVLTLEALSPVHNRDDGRPQRDGPGRYEPRRDLLRHDGRGRGRGGGRGRGNGRGGGRGRGGVRGFRGNNGFDELTAEGRAAEMSMIDFMYRDPGLEERKMRLMQERNRVIQLRKKCATEAAALARHEAWKQRLEPIPNFGSIEPEPLSLSPVERERTEVPVRYTEELPFHWLKNDFMEYLCPVDGLTKSRFGNRMKNLEYLQEKFNSGEWASKHGVTYTHDSSGCIPTREELTSLSIRGLDLKGTIVFENGGVIQTDRSNEIEKLWKDYQGMLVTDAWGIPALVQTEALLKKLKEHNEFHMQMCRIATAHRPGHYRKSLTEKYPSKMRVDEMGIFDRVKTMVGMDFHPPAGEYEQMPENSSWLSYGVRDVVMCDNPECCRMSHFASKIVGEVEVQLRANGHKHRPDIPINAVYARIGPNDFCRGSYEAMTNLLLDRLMYRRKDEINGNFDICYQCLHKKAHPVE